MAHFVDAPRARPRRPRRAARRARSRAGAGPAGARPRRPARPCGDPRRARAGRSAASGPRRRAAGCSGGRARSARRAWRPHGLLEAALVADPPHLLRDGGMVAAGYDAELDTTRRLRDEGRGVIAGLQGEYIRRSGVPTLKIRHNNVLGYYIETPSSHAEKMLAPPRNCSSTGRPRRARCASPRWRSQRSRRRSSAPPTRRWRSSAGCSRSCARRCWRRPGRSAPAARAMAEVDLAAGLADLAVAEGWTRAPGRRQSGVRHPRRPPPGGRVGAAPHRRGLRPQRLRDADRPAHARCG